MGATRVRPVSEKTGRFARNSRALKVPVETPSMAAASAPDKLVEVSHSQRLCEHGFHFSYDPVDQLTSLPFCVNYFRIRFRGWNIFRPVDFTRVAVFGERMDCE